MTATTTPPITTGFPTRRRSRRSRQWWLAGGALLAVIAIMYGTLNLVSALAFTRHQFTHVLRGDVRDVTVHNDAGAVHVVATDRTDVSVAGKGVQGISKPSHHEDLRDGHVDIGAACPFSLSSICSMQLTISVPRDVPLTIRSSGGGVTIDDSRAAVDAGSSGGGVRVTGATGPLHLRSSGGGINATNLRSSTADVSSSGGGVTVAFVAPPTAVNASSSGGGVTVVVPNTGHAYRVDASSSGGGVHNDIDSSPTSTRVIDAHSSGGGVTVRYGP